MIKEGFTENQAQGLVSLISQVIEDSMEATSSSLLKKTDKDLFNTQLSEELNKIRNDIRLLENQEFERLDNKLLQINDRLSQTKLSADEHISRNRSGLLLDLNLEKSRVEAEAAELIQEIDEAGELISKEIQKMSSRLDDIKVATYSSLGKMLAIVFIGLFGVNVFEYYRNKKDASLLVHRQEADILQ